MAGDVDVVSAELRAAAARITTAVEPVSRWTLSAAGSSPTSLGHNELAEVVSTFCSKVSEVVSQTAAGDEQAATELDVSAASYDGVDDASALDFAGLRAGWSTRLSGQQ